MSVYVVEKKQSTWCFGAKRINQKLTINRNYLREKGFYYGNGNEKT